MASIKALALVSASMLAVLAASCSDKSTSSTIDMPTNGTVSLYVTDAPGDVSSCNVKISHLAIYDSMGHKVTLIDAGSPSQTVDLVQAHSNPAFMSQFNVPAGTYNALECTIDGVNFTMMDSGATCTFTDGTMTFPKMMMQGTMMQVDATGTKLTVDIPIVSGNCPGNGMMGTLSFGSMSEMHGRMM